MLTSPPDWSEESRLRLNLSRRICDSCPIDLGREIAMTGSAANGIADARSDVELNLWVDHPPNARARRDWLESVGCEDIVLDREQSGDGTVWSHLKFSGMLVELGWQPIQVVPKEIDSLLRGNVIDHWALIKAWVLETAIPLRSGGAIGAWKTRLAQYPEALQVTLTSAASRDWRFPHILDARWSLAERGERYAVTRQACSDLQQIFRILFAVNRRWEPEWKWLRSITKDLNDLPVDFHTRVDGILIETDLSLVVKHTLELAADVLLLASHDCGASEAAANIRRSLSMH